jgi:hypothetical protein
VLQLKLTQEGRQYDSREMKIWIEGTASIVAEVLEDRYLQNQPLPMAEIINNKNVKL